MNEPDLIAIDAANRVFEVCELDAHMKVFRNGSLRRVRPKTLMAQRPADRAVKEACYSSHYWAREFAAMGHDVRVIPAQQVKPFVRGKKNDANEADQNASTRAPKASADTVAEDEDEDELDIPAESPVLGFVCNVLADHGTAVEAGEVVLIAESMKIEVEVQAPVAGTVMHVLATTCTSVEAGQDVALIDPA